MKGSSKLTLCFLIFCNVSNIQAFTIPSPSRRSTCAPIAQSHLQSASIILYSTRKNQGLFGNPTPPSKPPPRDLHAPTISAISASILLRSQNKPDMPLRFVPNGKMEPWEITLTAGKIAQPAVTRWRDSLPPNEDTDVEQIKEEMEVMAGRIVATVARLEELEGELLRRCEKAKLSADDLFLLGVPMEEITALQDMSDSKRIENAIAAIDAACLVDDTLRYNRAKTVFAMFLHELEGPGLRQNNVVLPCMEVDFLGKREWELLFSSNDDAVRNITEPIKAPHSDNSNEQTNASNRPSLHPLVIEAIEESFRLRAKNSTTSPLRKINDSTEWYEIEFSAMKHAERFLEQHIKPTNGFQWTEEELHTIGGRIVGVLMRLDDLEWEWHHRVTTSSLGKVVPVEDWRRNLGLHPGSVEQICLRTVDSALVEDEEFARRRAEIMYAMFLMNIEEPGMKASGSSVVGGSSAKDFIEDSKYIELMMPRLKK